MSQGASTRLHLARHSERRSHADIDDGTDDEWQGKRDGSAIVSMLWYALGLVLLCSLMFLPALGEPVDWTPAPEFATDAQRHYDVWVSLKDVQP